MDMVDRRQMCPTWKLSLQSECIVLPLTLAGLCTSISLKDLGASQCSPFSLR